MDGTKLTRRRALFLDRDGVVIEDVGYPSDPAGVRLIDGALDGMSRIAEAGWRLVLVSNQSGVGRGLVTPDQAASVHRRLIQELEAGGVQLAGIYYCFHAPGDGCRCRKPSPGLVLEAARDLQLDLERSVMVGDKESDLEAGRRAGCRVVAFGPARSGVVSAEGDLSAPDWHALVDVLDAGGHRSAAS
jgi:D-glycero-D-manno-heptose 1,7-bisphosphate phosphatase